MDILKTKFNFLITVNHRDSNIEYSIRTVVRTEYRTKSVKCF